MKEIVKYIDGDVSVKSASWYVFEVMSSGSYSILKRTIADYLLTPGEKIKNDQDFRYSHLDMYYLSIVGNLIPPRFVMGSQNHPGGQHFTEDDKTYLEDFFLERREEIIKNIVRQIPTEEDFKAKLSEFGTSD